MIGYITLPFSPTDLVEIYTNKEKLLKVDLSNSVLNIPMKQLLVYISNTKFEVEFDDITDELLVAYMESNFSVDCPQIDEIIVGALHGKYDIPAISEHITDVKKIVKAIPNYMLDNIELYSDNTMTAEKPEFVYIDTPLSIGFNAIKLIKVCQVLMVDLIQKEGIEDKIYTYYMNNNPKYAGNDFYFYLYSNDFMSSVASIVGNLIKENTND